MTESHKEQFKKVRDIGELEKLLQQDEDVLIQILPDGTMMQAPETEAEQRKLSKPKRPLTFRENLGGEYAGAPK